MLISKMSYDCLVLTVRTTLLQFQEYLCGNRSFQLIFYDGLFTEFINISAYFSIYYSCISCTIVLLVINNLK